MVEKRICAVTSCRMLPMCSGGLGAGAAAASDTRDSALASPAARAAAPPLSPAEVEAEGGEAGAASRLPLRGTTRWKALFPDTESCMSPGDAAGRGAAAGSRSARRGGSRDCASENSGAGASDDRPEERIFFQLDLASTIH